MTHDFVLLSWKMIWLWRLRVGRKAPPPNEFDDFHILLLMYTIQAKACAGEREFPQSHKVQNISPP